jgi:hypothetical protein
MNDKQILMLNMFNKQSNKKKFKVSVGFASSNWIGYVLSKMYTV